VRHNIKNGSVEPATSLTCAIFDVSRFVIREVVMLDNPEKTSDLMVSLLGDMGGISCRIQPADSEPSSNISISPFS
jgi:hypothetical protein